MKVAAQPTSGQIFDVKSALKIGGMSELSSGERTKVNLIGLLLYFVLGFSLPSDNGRQVRMNGAALPSERALSDCEYKLLMERSLSRLKGNDMNLCITQ